MMKWGFALNAGLGSLLVASAIGVPQSGKQDLDMSLDRAARGLEELAGLRARIERGEKAAIDVVLERAEAPGPDPRADEDRLAQLRFEVSRLQIDWDAIAAASPESAGKPMPEAPAQSASVQGRPSPPAGGSDAHASLTAFESPGFSVDPLRQGEALYRAGKYSAAITALHAQPDDARCQYWTARALEQLGRIDEALAMYTTIGARKDAGWAAERARTDLVLLQWKKDMSQEPSAAGRSATQSGKVPTSSAPAPKVSPSPAPAHAEPKSP